MRRFVFFLLLFVSVNWAEGQTLFPEVFSCFGGSSQNNSVQLTWTAGEPLYTTVQNNDNILTQGFNQSVYVTAVATGIDEAAGYSISVYPNPTADFLTVSLPSDKAFNLQLWDTQGRKMLSRKSSADAEQIDISQFTSGVYLLTISDGKQTIKIFKILKK